MFTVAVEFGRSRATLFVYSNRGMIGSMIIARSYDEGLIQDSLAVVLIGWQGQESVSSLSLMYMSKPGVNNIIKPSMSTRLK